MKTDFLKWAGVMGIALNLSCAGLYAADSSNPAAIKEKSTSGIATDIDRQEKTIAVKGFWGTRTYNIAQDCTFSLEDKEAAMLSDLRPGEKVQVRYENDHGVLVAHQVNQQNIYYAGYITAIDPGLRLLIVKKGRSERKFEIPQDCVVALKDDKTGSLDDLKIGNSVKVVYETPGKELIVRRIEQPDATFVGTIQAIDGESGTVKVKRAGNEKKFVLGDDCKIVTAGKTDAKLNELQIGDRAAVTYEDDDGVLVANRIGRVPQPPPAQNASRNDGKSKKLNSYPSMPGYPE